MKHLSCLLLLLINLNSFGQNERIKDFVSQVFFGYEIFKKPDKIESSSYRPFDTGDSYNEKNIIRFDSHPLIKSKIEGQYNIKYLYFKEDFENYGIYQLEMKLVFDNYKLCKETFEKLKRMCRDNASSKSESIGWETTQKSERCIYDYGDKLQIPRIILNYHKTPHTITINIYTTYSFNKFRKFPNRLW